MNGYEYKKNEKIAFWVAALIVIVGGVLGLITLL
jgi:hypothetical protein